MVAFVFGGGAAEAVAGVAGGRLFGVGVEGFAEDCKGGVRVSGLSFGVELDDR